MKRMAVLTLIISVLFLFASCAKQDDKKGPYLAKVGKVKIMQSDLDREMKNLPAFAQKIFEGSEGKERFLNELVKKELLYQEALKQGLDKDADYIEKVADFEKITLISKLLENEIEDKAQVTDEDIKKYYDVNLNGYGLGLTSTLLRNLSRLSGCKDWIDHCDFIPKGGIFEIDTFLKSIIKGNVVFFCQKKY